MTSNNADLYHTWLSDWALEWCWPSHPSSVGCMAIPDCRYNWHTFRSTVFIHSASYPITAHHLLMHSNWILIGPVPLPVNGVLAAGQSETGMWAWQCMGCWIQSGRAWVYQHAGQSAIEQPFNTQRLAHKTCLVCYMWVGRDSNMNVKDMGGDSMG